MEEFDLISSFEKISSIIPNRLLKLEGYMYREKCQEKLEIIIFKGFSSSTTHPIEIDLEKKVIECHHVFINFKLYKAPLSKSSDGLIRQNQNFMFFLNQNNWI